MAKHKYGNEHRRLRRLWMPVVAKGIVVCAHPDCGKFIAGGSPDDRGWTGTWHLGHRWDKNGFPLESLPMHRKCNCTTAITDRERDSGQREMNGSKNSRLWG